MSYIKLVFYKAPGTFFDKLIRWWTSSKYSHCEILFDDGRMFSADGWDAKEVRYTTKYNLDNWDVITIPMSANRAKYLTRWCDTKVGMKYDWAGVIRFVLPILPQREDKWFCSELCGAALKYAGVFGVDVDVHGLSPQKLYMAALRARQR